MARELRFDFPLPNGFHARPANAFQEAAASYRARITFANRRTKALANAKSVLALVATLTRHNDPCALSFEGIDEDIACDGMRRFLDTRFPLCDEAPPAAPPASPDTRRLPRALRSGAAQVLIGAPAGGGVARAPAYLGNAGPSAHAGRGAPVGTRAEEQANLEAAFGHVGAALSARMNRAGNDTEHAILKAHIAILEDEEFRRRIDEQLGARGAGAARAVAVAAERLAAILRESGTEYLRERAFDITDLAAQLLAALPGGAGDERLVLERDSVLVVDALSPSQFIALDKHHLKALVLREGGITSHTVILARAWGVPCVTGIAEIGRRLAQGQDVVVDGGRGLVVVDPSPAIVRFYEGQSRHLAAIRLRAERFKDAPGATSDGRKIEVAANVASLDEVRVAFESGADGIGLFRTELLFMDRDEPPTEDEQTAVYSETVQLAQGRPVIVRTFDVGGDKSVPYLGLLEERNPALGFRAVRLYERHEGVLATQLRAMLRASQLGNLKIMFPMVSSVEELRALRHLLGGLMSTMTDEGVAYNPNIEIGIMVEVPSAAFIIDELAQDLDFFSIGSNDLAQYFFAADRGNESVARFGDPFQPAFLRLLKMIADAAHRRGKWVGVCGELAGNARALPLLVGCGVDELSLAPAAVPTIKCAVSACHTEACARTLNAALAAGTAAEVETLLHDGAQEEMDSSLVNEELVLLDSSSRTRDEAIRELVNLLHAAGRVDDPDGVEDAIWEREDLHSTGVGFAVAIPHCKARGVVATSVALLRSDAGVAWDSLDAEPVRLVILIAVNAQAHGDEHLRMIAALSRKLMDEAFRHTLLTARDADDVVALLRAALAASGQGGQ